MEFMSAFRHPFLLYPHFIEHWKKRLNAEEDDFLDDSEFEGMFSDEEDEMDKKKKKKTPKKKENEHEKKVHTIVNLLSSCDFLV